MAAVAVLMSGQKRPGRRRRRRKQAQGGGIRTLGPLLFMHKPPILLPYS